MNFEKIPKDSIVNPKDEDLLDRSHRQHPSRIGVGRVGPRPQTKSLLKFRSDHAEARDAVTTEVSQDVIDELDIINIQSCSSNKSDFISDPTQGQNISTSTADLLRKQCKTNPQIQIIISDGLSSTAVEKNVPELLPVLLDGLSNRGLDVGTPIFVKYGRVNVMDAIGEELGADCCVNLIGERPGLATNESLSAYFIYNPKRGAPTSEKSVISNIHRNGIPPVEAGAEIASVLEQICENQNSGFDLDDR